ncbi:FtsX-like permease family protein [Thiospirochaeta perfilievii]|uniref:FtsX-like permease family protein n=1 Tax=Thiospirochaeta perfilievii TaxID=252967 RepID=A0A5C1QEF5_9SPIO|nr:ABC transporter permease [Thiospirochaeta perfilievii]QEN05094.1 FtsX-like permease family protein [Thiospirochaeta perfilievii]
MLLDQLILAKNRIKDRLQESLMVIIGLGFGIAVVSIVITVVYNFNNMINQESESEWYRNIFVIPSEYMYNNDSSIQKIGNLDSPKINFSMGYMEEIKKFCPTIDFAFYRLWINLEPSNFEEYSENRPWWESSLSGIGISEDYLKFLGMEIDKGSFFSQEDFENGSNVIIIGGNLAHKLFPNGNGLGKVLSYNNLDYTIVGILKVDYGTASPSEIEDLKESPWDNNNGIMLPYTNVINVNEWNTIDQMTFGVSSNKDLKKGVKEISTYLKRDFPNNEVYIESSLDWSGNDEETFIKVLYVIGLIAFICLIIATLNNLNLMLARVLRQKKGLGISISLGATKRDIFTSVFIESALLGVLGGILGILLSIIFGAVIGNIISSFDTWASMDLSIVSIFASLILSLILTIIFSIYPGIEATRISPSMVLREE